METEMFFCSQVLSQADQAMTWSMFFEPQVLVFMIPISAIVGGCSVAIAKMYFAHQERIELIRQGIHPDRQEAAELRERVDAETVEYN